MPSCVVHSCMYIWKKRDPAIILYSFANDPDTIRKWLLQTTQYANNIDELEEKVIRAKKTDLYRMCSLYFLYIFPKASTSATVNLISCYKYLGA